MRALSLDNVPSRPFRLGYPQVAATSGERLRLSLQWQAGPQARVGRSMSRPPTPSFSFGDQHRLSNQASAVVDHNAHHIPAARWLPVTAVSSVRLASDQRQRTDGDEPRRGERGAIPNDVRRFVRPTRNRDRWPTLLPNRQRMSEESDLRTAQHASQPEPATAVPFLSHDRAGAVLLRHPP